MNSTQAGQQAEAAAAAYLTAHGFTILERNYRTPRCEVDIIARKGSCLHFVEVKYRVRSGQGAGLDYITAKKQRQMRYAAETWLHEHSWRGEATLSAVEVTGVDFEVGEFIESIWL